MPYNDTFKQERIYNRPSKKTCEDQRNGAKKIEILLCRIWAMETNLCISNIDILFATLIKSVAIHLTTTTTTTIELKPYGYTIATINEVRIFYRILYRTRQTEIGRKERKERQERNDRNERYDEPRTNDRTTEQFNTLLT